jgi:hypothetical protein
METRETRKAWKVQRVGKERDISFQGENQVWWSLAMIAWAGRRGGIPRKSSNDAGLAQK